MIRYALDNPWLVVTLLWLLAIVLLIELICKGRN